MNQPILRAENVRKVYGQTEALRGVDVEIGRGEVVAVMGPSGSGKSTLLHCLAGVVLPDEGIVSFDGRVISSLNEQTRSKLRLTTFGFVFQFGQLLPDLSALDNVCVPLLLNGRRRHESEEEARVWLERLGLKDMERKQPWELSGGQAQRVAIARALVTNPAVLFADEPTGSLDSLAAETVMNAMLDLVRDIGTTVVIITHDPRTASFADRDIIIRDGLCSTPARMDVR